MKNVLFDKEFFLIENGYGDESKFITPQEFNSLPQEEKSKYAYYAAKNMHYPLTETAALNDNDFSNAHKIESFRKLSAIEAYLKDIRTYVRLFYRLTCAAIAIFAFCFVISIMGLFL